MENDINRGVTCGVTSCRYNCDGMSCKLGTIHVGNACESEQCTCCDSFRERI